MHGVVSGMCEGEVFLLHGCKFKAPNISLVGDDAGFRTPAADKLRDVLRAAK